MNCKTMIAATAWPCSSAVGACGEDVTVLAPPVPMWDGSVIPLYVMSQGARVEITDDGGVLEHLEKSGFGLLADKRRRRGLDSSVSKWGLSFGDEMQLICRPDAVAFGLQKFLGALFAVAQWEADNAGKSLDGQLLIAEAEMYLRALSPSAAFTHDVNLVGITGRPQTFPLKVDDTYYEATGTHPVNSAAVVKKVYDVRLVRDNKDVPITILVEDRQNTDRAKADIQLLTQLAHVIRLSDLQATAMKVLTAH